MRELRGRGVSHNNKKDEECNNINFSAQTWGDSIKKHFTMSSSLNIITFLEINTDEQLEYVKDEFVGICEDIVKIIEKQMEKDSDTNFFYEMHDCKFLYILTKHVQWNQSWYPYLQCKCRKGVGAKDNCKHTCTFMKPKSNFEASLNHWNIQHSKWHNYKCSIATTNNKQKQKAVKKGNKKTTEQASAVTNSTNKTYTEHTFRKGKKKRRMDKGKTQKLVQFGERRFHAFWNIS